MSVLAITVVPLDLAVYDQICPHLLPPLKAAPGFVAHTVHSAAPGTFTVTEIWDPAADFEAFFSTAVKPNLPEGTQPSVIELHGHAVSDR